MSSLYLWLNFVHVAAVIVWVGGLVTLVILNRRLATAPNRQAIAAVAQQAQWFGTRVLALSGALTLLAGVAMQVMAGFGFPLWVVWGFVAIAVFLALGTTEIRRASEKLLRSVTDSSITDAEVAQLLRRLSTLNTVNVVVLLSTVWAMVVKPTL